MRDAELAASIQNRGTISAGESAEAYNGNAIVTESETAAASIEAMRSADLGEKRAGLFAKALRESGAKKGNTRAQVFPIASIAVLWLDDPHQLAAPSGTDSGSNTLNGLVRALENLAAELDIPYLKIVGNEFVFAAGIRGQPLRGARAIAKMALGIRDHCDKLMGSGDKRLHFRLGIDTGPTLGCTVGRGDNTYNLWGEASRTARYMALSGTSGSIQVTESTYELLRGEFLFRARGRFYLEECGETNTYILADQI